MAEPKKDQPPKTPPASEPRVEVKDRPVDKGGSGDPKKVVEPRAMDLSLANRRHTTRDD